MNAADVREITAFVRRVGRTSGHTKGAPELIKRIAWMIEQNFLPWKCCRCKETFTEERGASMVEGPLCMHCTRILAHYVEHPESNPYPNSVLGLPTEP
jgi:hypothetical protein